MEWLVIVAVLVLGLTAVYVLQTPKRRHELFLNYYDSDATKAKGPDSFVPLLAEFGQGLPLSDFLKPATGLTKVSADSCAATDKARQSEVGGQYVQRTNNYKRDYPDDCSSLMSDFVGGFYAPKEGGVGMTVPCDGLC